MKHFNKSERLDFSIIAECIENNSRVLDVGCGSGDLLYHLSSKKQVQAMGVDIDRDKIINCIAKGIPVILQDLNTGLANFKTDSFDYVILSQTLQVVHHPIRLILDILRIGKNAIVSFPNFGNWKVRFGLLLSGRMPKSKTFPYEWYDTPNIHNVTVKDFRDLCRNNNIKIIKEVNIRGKKYSERAFIPNLFSEGSVVLITK